jgi:hypothetical protein
MARYLFHTNHLSAALDDEPGVREHKPGESLDSSRGGFDRFDRYLDR